MGAILGDAPEPEERIFGAMIRAAIVESVHGAIWLGSCRKDARETTRVEAYAWFTSIAFRELCALFNADPAEIRKVSLRVVDRNRGQSRRQLDWST